MFDEGEISEKEFYDSGQEQSSSINYRSTPRDQIRLLLQYSYYLRTLHLKKNKISLEFSVSFTSQLLLVCKAICKARLIVHIPITCATWGKDSHSSMNWKQNKNNNKLEMQ